MNDDSDQLITLAETLARRTRSGRAEWSETDEPGRYLYMGGNGGVTISSKPSGLMSNRGSGSQTEMNYELNIVNNKGQVVTSKQTNYPMDSGDFETPDARATLEELYKAAVGAANEADKVVKSLLTELMETEPF